MIENRSKDYILNYYPNILEKYLPKKKITWKDKCLLSDFFIHLISTLLTKYYFTKENEFVLNSSILRETYGKNYNFYIDYLVENGLLIVYKNYQKGRISRTYQLSEVILNCSVSRYENPNESLLKKKQKWISLNLKSSESPICYSIRERLVEDLYSISIQEDRASIELLSKIYNSQTELERDNYALDCIKKGQIYYHFDQYGRFHTPFTILPKKLRNSCLTIEDQDICELDIPNSQPLFLLKLIKLNPHIQVELDELDFFSDLVRESKFYQHLSKILDQKDLKDVKKIVFEILFGKNISGRGIDLFSTFFPSILNFLKTIKKEKGDYRWVSHELQRLESNFIFNKVVKKIYSMDNTIKLFTVHDSIFCKKDKFDTVSNIFILEIKKEFDF